MAPPYHIQRSIKPHRPTSCSTVKAEVMLKKLLTVKTAVTEKRVRIVLSDSNISNDS